MSRRVADELDSERKAARGTLPCRSNRSLAALPGRSADALGSNP